MVTLSRKLATKAHHKNTADKAKNSCGECNHFNCIELFAKWRHKNPIYLGMCQGLHSRGSAEKYTFSGVPACKRFLDSNPASKGEDNG